MVRAMASKRKWILCGELSRSDIDYLVSANLTVELEEQANIPVFGINGMSQEVFARPRVYITTRDHEYTQETFLKLRFADRLQLVSEEYYWDPEREL